MENQQQQNQQPQVQQIVIKTQKSPFLAALLAFLFGPLGMLYSTVIGAIVMFIVDVLMVIFTAGLGLILTIPIGMIWAYMAAKKQNETTN